MSIPPLVCSTPPPPDQCEDDKDTEDYDLHYNLSQEDEYDYGSFSTYNHFQSAISVNKTLSDPIVNNTCTDKSNSSNNIETNKNTTESETLQWTNTTIEKKLDNDHEQGYTDTGTQEQNTTVESNNYTTIQIENKMNIPEQLETEDKIVEDELLESDKKISNEEELNIEDLNLTIEEDSLNSIVKNALYDNADSDKSESSDKEKSPNIPDINTNIITGDPSETLPLDDITISPPSLDDADDAHHLVDNLKIEDEHGIEYSEIQNVLDIEPSFDMSEPLETQVSETLQEVLSEVNNETDDEFGDFNDFHSTSDNKAPTIVDACDNPWETNQSDSEFGTFEAHFDNDENIEPPLFQGFNAGVDMSAPEGQSSPGKPEDEDDFGDFDDFKSSAQEPKEKNEIQDPLSQVPVLDFQTSENESQILENINKILNSIFEEDIPEPESVFDGRLENLLSETWGHLLETDVRQPYIVNWNSSVGQKTLLKALCIDSRNILFGPKWSYNMPKYAANLSTAPLQPQKQTTPSGPTHPETSDKHATKTTGTWSDPFTSDGQESCNKETNAAAPKRPTDLNVFDNDLSTKSDKIYSNTIDVQPIRQINLPDTHIFTPTDSETPRSKTIHYNGPAVFLSQSSAESDKKSIEVSTVETLTDTKILDDADYSDFQDFKGSLNTDVLEAKSTTGLSAEVVGPLASSSQLPSTSTGPVGILQPIKIEPNVPTLNWPSPGEVKETFDDFSEFASSTTWNNDIQETPTPTIAAEITQQIEVDTTTDKSIINNEEKTTDCDDDFDTFQSALPPNQSTQIPPPISNFSDFKSSDFSKNVSAHGTSNQEPELDFVFPKMDIKSDPISHTKSNDILSISDPFMQQSNAAISFPKVKEPVAKVPTPQPLAPPLIGVMQPTVTPTQTQQSSAQILQPLSLESFSQINWPNPGINLQDLSRFNPVETLNSLKSELSVSGNSKGASPVHSQKSSVQNQPEDDIWGEFVSSKPKPQQSLPKKTATFVDDDEWTDFVSSPTVKPQNGLNTISLNVHANLNIQKSTKQTKQNSQALEIPITHYITPKSSNHSSYNDRHFQNL